jgi:hypothetical protein
MLTSLIIKEMQIKTTMKYEFLPVGMAIIKLRTKQTKQRWRGMKLEHLCPLGVDVKWYNSY